MSEATLEARPGERPFWRFAALLLGVVALLKGLRLPSRWAATQALIDYSQGFVKRGLFGATLAHAMHMERYTRFSLFAYLSLAVLLILLVVFIGRSGTFSALGSGEPIALFCASYAMTYLAHMAGYLDLVLAIIAIAILLVRSPLYRLAAAIPASIVALLIHEMFLFVFVPVLLFSFLLDAERTADPDTKKRIHLMSLALLLVSLVTTLKLALTRPLTAHQALLMRARMEGRVNFEVRGDVFDVMTRSLHDNLYKMAWVYGHDLGWWVLFLICIVVFLPTQLLLLNAVRVAITALNGSRRLMFAALAAAISPWLMFALAWDSGRWDALVCLESLLVVVLIARHLPPGAVVFSQRYRQATILVIALSMASGGALMDHLQDNTFPFILDLVRVGSTLSTNGWVAPH